MARFSTALNPAARDSMRIMPLLLLLAGGSLAAQSPGARESAAAGITATDLMRRISIIANDSMLGRDTPSRGVELTAAYVGSEFRRAGLRPGGDHGGYIQQFGIHHWIVDTVASAVRLTVGSTQAIARLGVDARYIDGRIPGGAIRGPLVLLPATGSPEAVRNRIVLLAPDLSRPIPPALSERVLQLAAAGPKAIVILSNRDSAGFADRLRQAAATRVTRDLAPASGGAPIIEVHERALKKVLNRAGIDPGRLRAGERSAARSLAGLNVEIRLVKKVLRQAQASNVVGILDGSDPALRHEYLAVSAHIDHIGITPGMPDSINNGADDNASGVAGLLALARAFAMPDQRPRRSFIFLAPGAEEPGLLGSAHFTEHPPVPLQDIVANVNMDLIGRNWPDSVIAVGIDQSSLGENLRKVVQAHPELQMTPIADRWPEERIFYRSDHYNFARRGVPVLFFTSGTHADYHRPSDEPDRINGEKESRLVRLLYYLAADIANSDSRPRWFAESYRQIVRGR
jgi:hypothetical protein